ncbi:MAG: hypothetical protein AAGL69_03190 [Pseudomonadota bacterium]
MTKIWILLAIIVSLAPHSSAHADGASSSHEVRRSEATGESPLSRDLRSKLENNARLSDSEIAMLNELVLQRIYSDLLLPETQVKAEVRTRFDASGEFERAQEELAIRQASLHKLKALLPKLSDETLTDVGAFRTA